MKRKIGLILMIMAVVLAGCGSSKEQKGADLGSIRNGIVLYYDDSEASAKLLEALDGLSASDSFELVKIHAVKDQAMLDKYESDNKKLVESYKEVRSLEAKLSTLKPGTNSFTDEAALKNNINLNYRRALNLVKNGKLSSAQEKELDNLVKDIASKQELNEDQLRRLLELQTDARLKVPVYSSVDGDASKEKLPVMKVIYEGNYRTSFAFGLKPIPADTLANAEQLKYYLKEKAWITNFGNSSDGDTIKKKLDNKDTFILLVWGNSCPHCHKVMPVLDKLSDQTGIKVERIDTFNAANNKAYAAMVASGKYGLTEIKWVPTLVYIKDGKQISAIGASDWNIENATADLGYDVNQEKLKAFIQQAK